MYDITGDLNMKALNKNLNSAKENKNDEFYTKYSDIKKEMEYHKDSFQGKVVYCNCDNPYESNFVKYFISNFNKLGLKMLITSNYGTYKKPQLKLTDNFGEDIPICRRQIAYKTIIPKIDDKEDIDEIIKRHSVKLKGNGDFRSRECIKLLKLSDIVVTNPPFSLFREYMAQLIRYKKQFIILGNQNAITYKDIFRQIQKHKMWWGNSVHKGSVYFKIPDRQEINATQFKTDEAGNKYIGLSAIRWFTNMNQQYNEEFLELNREYKPELYPKYENIEGIEVSKVKNIPKDYYGVMGVPITFFDKYNPDQFELLNHCARPEISDKGGGVKATYRRLLIRRK